MYFIYHYWNKTLQKRQVNQNNHILLKPEKEFEARNNEKYKVKTIINNKIYEKKKIIKYSISIILFSKRAI